MSVLYELVGRFVVAAVKARFGREIRIAAAAGVALAALGVGAYLATRDGDGDADEA
jgi:hypothetical protein